MRAVIEANAIPHVYIVLLNWNGWSDTVECLESVFKLNYPRFTVIVCDNNSSDNSIQKIEEWACGNLPASCKNSDLASLVYPAIPKPLPFISVSSLDALNQEEAPAQLILIQTGANLGFAGGNNVGMRYALSHGNCDYVWLLNNDTVVDRQALSEMIEMVEANPNWGVCGSQLRNYWKVSEVHTMGGRRYAPWSGRTFPLREIPNFDDSTKASSPDYVEGASMLITRKCLDEVGLLEEGYFLYYEELDLIHRSHIRFRHGFSVQSIVYHKEGSSIGTAESQARRSSLAEYYQARNRVVFTWKYYPWFLPSVTTMIGVSIVHRALIARPQNAIAIMRGAIAGLKCLVNRPSIHNEAIKSWKH